ncbi:hypothetical protein [Terasakiispira papahanaumokuakeensis]|uniref:hypothetical protein n=1 Tax=Terasakiispira papahanaumokuakeensis TaxID=197479 RepID=UPI001C48F056|nr:hypothetical protein [Terasakiispira papahanaumokuakeensis]
MSRPDLNRLQALDARLDEGSVIGAERRMNLSPPGNKPGFESHSGSPGRPCSCPGRPE